MAKLINKIVGIIVGLGFLGRIKSLSSLHKNYPQLYFILWPASIKECFVYFIRGYFIQDLVLANALTKEGFSLKFVLAKRLHMIPKKSKVVYSMTLFTPEYKKSKRVSQGESLFRYLKGIEDVEFYPNLEEARMWENKEYMHDVFEKQNISCPNTAIVGVYISLDDIKNIDYPVLSKAANSNQSKGINIHHNAKSLMSAVNSKLSMYSSVLIQKVVDITFDIRVVVIGGNVVYHYWRHKPIVDDGHFITTSTSNGGKIDIEELPELIEKACVEAAFKLKLSMAAFDVTLDQGKVVFFEVSPSFILNPIPENEAILKSPYIQYKKRYITYNNDMINQFTEIKRLQVRTWKL